MNLITEREYNDEIRSIIDSAYQEYAAHGDDEDPVEWLHRWLHETIDGHQWVIYTYYNTQVLTHSVNENAYWEVHGEAPPADSYGTLMAVLAYSAMEADVMAHIDMDRFEVEEAS